jgi:hypothetical protein
MMKKTILYIVVSIFFLGCQAQTKYIAYEKVYVQESPKNVNQSVNQEAEKSGVIKGFIEKLYYKKETNEWLYEIKGEDVSNAKLPFARFSYFRKVANVGESIYAIFDDGKLKEYFLLSGTKEMKKVEPEVSREHKRTKSRQVLKEVPKEEMVILD